MERTVFRVSGSPLVHLFKHDQLVPVVVTGDEKTFAADNVDGVASEELLSDDGAETTHEVVFGVDG